MHQKSKKKRKKTKETHTDGDDGDDDDLTLWLIKIFSLLCYIFAHSASLPHSIAIYFWKPCDKIKLPQRNVQP